MIIRSKLEGPVSAELPQKMKRPAFADTLKFPDDVTELDARNISELMGRYAQLAAYVAQEHAEAAVSMLQIKYQLMLHVSAFSRANPNTSHLEQWRRKALIEADPHHEQWMLRLTMAEVRKERASTFLATYERYITVLSRELSRKTAFRDDTLAEKYAGI